MKIILKKDVQGLGYKDDVLTVKDGYGRNYLLPQGFAVLATEHALKQLNEELKQRAHKLAKIKAEAEDKATKFEGVSLTIPVKVSESGTTYGSVGPAQIAGELVKLGFQVEPKNVELKPVKELGNHVAVLRLHKEVAIEIPFNVVADAAKEEDAPAEEAPKAEEAPTMEEEIEEYIESKTEEPAEE